MEIQIQYQIGLLTKLRQMADIGYRMFFSVFEPKMTRRMNNACLTKIRTQHLWTLFSRDEETLNVVCFTSSEICALLN